MDLESLTLSEGQFPYSKARLGGIAFRKGVRFTI